MIRKTLTDSGLCRPYGTLLNELSCFAVEFLRLFVRCVVVIGYLAVCSVPKIAEGGLGNGAIPL